MKDAPERTWQDMADIGYLLKLEGVKRDEPSDSWRLDLERDVPTTPDDVRALRECRAGVPCWLDLSADEIDAVLPEAALDRRPTAAGRTPFSLE